MRWYWWILLASFLRPGVEALMVAAGEWWYHARFRRDPGRFTQLIIQLTTTKAHALAHHGVAPKALIDYAIAMITRDLKNP